MSDRLTHRGPDAEGLWFDKDAGVGLSHRRLSILDLSADGRQPMHSASGRYTICYNGEIYNFPELREAACASGHPVLRGGSDTEVLLAAIESWGLLEAVQRSSGMFAFALWDNVERVLHLVRDRVGEKPLFYGWSGETFLFASELKAFSGFESFSPDVDPHALSEFLRCGYVPTPGSIYKGVRKLPPGTSVCLSVDQTGVYPKPTPYWSAKAAATAGIQSPFPGGDSDAIDQLDTLLRKTIGRQMVADVPLGAFLSGGIDSSVIVALMQSMSDRPVKTFTIGSENDSYDESRYAKDVALHLGTDHTELRVTPQDAREVIPKLPTLYDEPFADSSQIPTYLVSQLAKCHVTVSLSGDGADELFGGYNRHLTGERLWSHLRIMPNIFRIGVAKLIRTLSPSQWDALFRIAPKGMSPRLPGQKLHKLSGILGVNDPAAMYRNLTSQWHDPHTLVRGLDSSPLGEDSRHWSELGNIAQEIMLADFLSYLPDDILAKVDRAAMGTSLETRVPYLDHAIIEFAFALPMDKKIRGRVGKWVLRQVLDRYVPRHLVERPKAGFGVPIEDWLRGPLRDWAESLLDERRLMQQGYLNPFPIRAAWQQHLSGTHALHHQLWNVLMFQTWLESS